MPPPKITLHRDEVYDKVWSTPVSSLADEYGISDVALRKICQKLDVPTPPRGYWAKRRHGYDVERPSLSPREEGQPTTHTISVRPTSLSITQALSEAGSAEGEDPSLKMPAVNVEERLHRPCRLVIRTRAALKNARPDTYGKVQPREKGTLPVSVHPSNVDRALRILDALVKAARGIGFPVKIDEEGSGRAYLAVAGEQIAFRLSERFSRVDPSENEKRSKWGPKYDYVSTGQFTLKFVDAHGPGRKKWSDSGKQQLEDLLADVLGRAHEVAHQEKQWRRELEERRRRREEERRQRLEEERRRKQEEARRRVLEDEAQQWRKSQDLRAYIREVERKASRQQISPDERKALTAWIEWARDHAQRLDPLSGEELPTGI